MSENVSRIAFEFRWTQDQDDRPIVAGGAEVVCPPCGAAAIADDPEPELVHEPTPAQRAELERHFGYDPFRR